MSRLIFVLSTPRSGSSAVALALEAAGVHMADRPQPADANNPAGYGEDLAFHEIDKPLTGHNYDKQWAEALPDALGKELEALLWRRASLHAFNGIKSPGLSYCLHLVLPMAEPLFEDVRLVVVRRNRLDRVRSLMSHSRRAWNGARKVGPAGAAKIMAEWEMALERQLILSSSYPLYAVRYERLIEHPEREVLRLLEYCLGASLAYRALPAAVAAIDPSLQRHGGMPAMPARGAGVAGAY